MKTVAIKSEAVYLHPPPPPSRPVAYYASPAAQVLLGVGSTRAVAAVFSWLRRTPGMQVGAQVSDRHLTCFLHGIMLAGKWTLD